jgi:hypothetical protein
VSSRRTHGCLSSGIPATVGLAIYGFKKGLSSEHLGFGSIGGSYRGEKYRRNGVVRRLDGGG